MSNLQPLQPDLPIFEKDFQTSAERLGSLRRIGTRLFRDLNMRGWLISAAKANFDGRQLSIRDTERLGDRPLVFLEIYYLEEEQNMGALSLNGLSKNLALGNLDEMIRPNGRLHEVRFNILSDVIDYKTHTEKPNQPEVI